MPTAYIQLGANCSSPCICPARATGCTDVFCPQEIDEDWGCCHSVMFLTLFQKRLCTWKGLVVKIWKTWWSFVRSCWWKESIMGNASRVWGVHCPGWGVDCRPLRKMRWYDFAKVQNALFCMFHVQDTQLYIPVEIALIWRGRAEKMKEKTSWSAAAVSQADVTGWSWASIGARLVR